MYAKTLEGRPLKRTGKLEVGETEITELEYLTLRDNNNGFSMINTDTIGNVKKYGAKGDGITDDTYFIQSAINNNKTIYFPSGTYISKALTFLDGQVVCGDGLSSKIILKAGENTVLFNAVNCNIQFLNLWLYGGVTTSFMGISSSNSRDALIISSQKLTKINNVIISGFGGWGIKTSDSYRDRLTHLVISDTEIYNCWGGLFFNIDNSEYSRFSNMSIHDCREGLRISAGNVTGINNIITDNYYGVIVYGTGIINNSHGNLNGCLINHNNFAIYTIDVGYGFNFIGCNIFCGDILLVNSYGININNGILDLYTYKFDGGNRNLFSNNFVRKSYDNIIYHNYNNHTDNTVFSNCYLPDGSAFGV